MVYIIDMIKNKLNKEIREMMKEEHDFFCEVIRGKEVIVEWSLQLRKKYYVMFIDRQRVANTYSLDRINELISNVFEKGYV